ncbi:similar to An17g00610 [Aspergillus luchuensis]|uniref:Similar to An17g00610 n=1 Tax=Aspergillus kawachii TaxID=1069201 RepID=A0A146FYA1_ASPKA|nr:similar to An17g00610 [Aspergillus luchuensis]
MRFWSWLRGEPRCEYYYKKRLEEIRDQIGDGTPKDPVKKWITEYNDEEALGFAILQRQRRLENEKQMAGAHQQQQQFRRRRCKQCQYQEEMCSACHEATQAADVPPSYSSQFPENLERDLAKLREELCKNRARLEAISQKLSDSRSWYFTLWSKEYVWPRTPSNFSNSL